MTEANAPQGTPRRQAEMSFFLLIGGAALVVAGLFLLLLALYVLYSFWQEGLVMARVGTVLALVTFGLSTPALGAALVLSALGTLSARPERLFKAYAAFCGSLLVAIGVFVYKHPAPPQTKRRLSAEDIQRRDESLALYAKAEAAYNAGDLDAAAQNVGDAKELSRYFPEAWILLGRIEFQRRRLAPSMTAFGLAAQQIEQPHEMTVSTGRVGTGLGALAYVGWAHTMIEQIRLLEPDAKSPRLAETTEDLYRTVEMLKRAARVAPAAEPQLAPLRDELKAEFARLRRPYADSGLPPLPATGLVETNAAEWFKFGLEQYGRSRPLALAGLELAVRAGAFGNGRFYLAQVYEEEGYVNEALEQIQKGFAEIVQSGLYSHPALPGTPEQEQLLGHRLWARAAARAASLVPPADAGAWLKQTAAQCREMEAVEPGSSAGERVCQWARSATNTNTR